MFSQYRGLRRELYILFIGRIMTNLGSMIWPMLTLILTRKLGMNASEAAGLMLVFSFVAIPVSLIGGKLTDRLNKRNIILFCDVISVICYIVCSLLPLTLFSIVLIGLAALFQTVEWPAFDALVADFTLPKDRQRAYSLNYLGNNLGVMLAPTIGGLLFNNYLNVAFLINGLAIFGSTLLIFFLIRNTEREYSEEDINEYENDMEGSVSAFKYILSSKTLLFYLLSMAVYNTVYHQFSFLVPLDMAVQFGENSSVLYGTLTSLNCLVVVLLTSVLTRYLRNIKDTDKLIAGMACVMGGLLIFRFLKAYVALIYVAVIVFTVGEIIHTLGASPFVSKRIPANYRGRIVSINQAIANIAVSLLTQLSGIFYDNTGSAGAWFYVTVLGVIALIFGAYVRKRDRLDYPSLNTENR